MIYIAFGKIKGYHYQCDTGTETDTLSKVLNAPNHEFVFRTNYIISYRFQMYLFIYFTVFVFLYYSLWIIGHAITI